MSTTQELILEAIRDRVEKPGLRFVDDRQYANTGTIRVYTTDLGLVGQVTYGFQPERCDFGPMTGYVAVLNYGRARTPGQVEAVCSTVPDLVDRVVTYLLKEAP